MQLPAIKEKLSTISIRRKWLFLIVSVLILVLIIIATEVIYCFNSEFCLLEIVSSYPSLSKVMGVKETELGLKRGNFTIDKQLNLITISGEILRVEKDKLTLVFKDGSKKTVSVKNGSRFLVFESALNEASESKNYTFDGNNLEDFMSSGYYLINAGFSNSEIFSDYNDGKRKLEFPIVVIRQSQ